MDSFAERLAGVRARVERAAREAGRAPETVRVLAVSKTFPAEAIREAYRAGARCFGENKIQELEAKKPLLPADIEWHFIGHLQSNKAAKAVELADWIHSVDSLKLLHKLDRVAGDLGRKPVILLEVKWDEYLPSIIQRAVQVKNRRAGAFSKYQACRIYG